MGKEEVFSYFSIVCKYKLKPEKIYRSKLEEALKLINDKTNTIRGAATLIDIPRQILHRHYTKSKNDSPNASNARIPVFEEQDNEKKTN